MKLVDGSEGAKLALNTDLTLQVTEMLQSSYPLDIGEDEYVLTADDASGYLFNYQTFAVGDKITLRQAVTTRPCPTPSGPGAWEISW